MTTGDLPSRIASLGRPLLLAFDVDGTLAPIVDDPDAARVPTESRALLRSLVGRRGLRIALVTGRDAASLSRVLKLEGAWRGMEHGRRVVGPRQSARRPQLAAADRERLLRFESWARREAVPAGARLERKPAARAVHVRELAARDPRAAARVLSAARVAADKAGLSPREGRAVVEAELGSASKADALDTLMRRTRADGVVYLGDDVTDVPALRRAEELGGVGVFVRSPERRKPRGVSAAVDGPAGVHALLLELVELLG